MKLRLKVKLDEVAMKLDEVAVKHDEVAVKHDETRGEARDETRGEARVNSDYAFCIIWYQIFNQFFI
jgi:hypothetical protein